MKLVKVNIQMEKSMLDELEQIAAEEREASGVYKIKYTDIILKAIKQYTDNYKGV